MLLWLILTLSNVSNSLIQGVSLKDVTAFKDNNLFIFTFTIQKRLKNLLLVGTIGFYID